MPSSEHRLSWYCGAEPAAAIPGEPIEFLGRSEEEAFSSPAGAIVLRDGPHGSNRYEACAAGVPIPGPDPLIPGFETIEAARFAVQTAVASTP